MRGLTAYANIFQLHGSRGPDRELLDNLNTVSNIEAIPTTRLSEVWLEQSFWNGQASLRAGQLAVTPNSCSANISRSSIRVIGRQIRR